jgi:MATE family multidrug resistance protein
VFLPDVLTAPFSSDGSVRPANGALMGEVRMLLRYVALYSLLDCVNCVVLGALQGAGDTRWPMRAFAGLSSCFLLVMLALDRLHAGLHAEWIAATAFVMVQALIWFLRFRSGCWRTFRIIEPDVPGH